MDARKAMSHEQAVELLPWLLTGAMGEEEQEIVREHAQSCVVCKRELQQLELINQLITEAARAGPIPPPDMRNINVRIDRYMERKGRFGDWFSQLGRRIHNPWRLAFAVQTALVIVLAALLLWPKSDEAEPAAPEYTTLSQPQGLPDGHYVRVVLRPDMAVSELTSLLGETNLTLADGPSERGVYTLAVPETLSQDDLEQLLASLQQNPNVLFAQWVTHR